MGKFIGGAKGCLEYSHLKDWEAGDSYIVDIGGARGSTDGSTKYGGSIGYTFHAPAGSSADGISLWFTERAIGTTDGRYDTKGNRWVEY